MERQEIQSEDENKSLVTKTLRLRWNNPEKSIDKSVQFYHILVSRNVIPIMTNIKVSSLDCEADYVFIRPDLSRIPSEKSWRRYLTANLRDGLEQVYIIDENTCSKYVFDIRRRK